MKTDKVAVILGTGPGLGSALAHKFSSEGYKIDRNFTKNI